MKKIKVSDEREIKDSSSHQVKGDRCTLLVTGTSPGNGCTESVISDLHDPAGNTNVQKFL